MFFEWRGEKNVHNKLIFSHCLLEQPPEHAECKTIQIAGINSSALVWVRCWKLLQEMFSPCLISAIFSTPSRVFSFCSRVHQFALKHENHIQYTTSEGKNRGRIKVLLWVLVLCTKPNAFPHATLQSVEFEEVQKAFCFSISFRPLLAADRFWWTTWVI